MLRGIVARRDHSPSRCPSRKPVPTSATSAARAEKTADGWVINGQKTWCSNAHFADNILLVARTGRGDGKHEGLTMFHVPADTAGLKISGIDTMGGKEVNDLYFTDCVLPDDAVVGEVGNGWRQLMAGPELRTPHPRRP